MQDYGWGLFRKGLKRRKSEVRRMRIMICLAVFFLALTLLLQDNLGAVQMELNYRNYGGWFSFDDDGFFTRYPYLETSGQAYVSSSIYTLTPISYSVTDGPINDLAPTIERIDEFGAVTAEKPPITDENGEYLPPQPRITVEDLGAQRDTRCRIGTFSEGFADKNGILLYDGRFPQTDSEIVMELSALHALGKSYELGQEISFYVAEKEPVLGHASRIENGIPQHEPEEYYLPLKLVSFTLVGTMQRYTARWSGGSLLPGAIVTKNALDGLETFENTYDFYDLKAGKGGEKVWEFAEVQFGFYAEKRADYYSRLDLQQGEKHPVEEWNTYAYTNPLWGSSDTYRYVTIILMAMSTCVLAYLMASYLSKRRQFFMRMRELGATAGEVWRMAAYECVGSALPFAAASLAAAYLFGVLASLILTKTLGIGFAFSFRPKTLLAIAGAAAAVLAVSLLAALLIYSGRGIADKKKAISKRASSQLRKKAVRKQRNERRYLSLAETLKRQRLIHPLKTALVRIACILIGAMILVSFMEVFAQARIWSDYRNSDTDIVGSVSGMFNRKTHGLVDTTLHWWAGVKRIDYEKDANLAISMPAYSFQNLLGESFFGELDSITGVKRVVRAALDFDHTLSWDGKWDGEGFHSDCLRKCVEYIPRKNLFEYELVTDGKHYGDMLRYIDNSLYSLQCFDKVQAYWNAAKPYLCGEADKDAFLRGEQVMIFVDENLYCADDAAAPGAGYMTREEFAGASENVWEKAPAFKAGDTVYIESLNKEERTAVTAAAVLPMTEYVYNELCWQDDESLTPVFAVIGSMELARRVQQADGIAFGANYVGLKLDSIAQSENSLKYVSELFVTNHVSYYDTIEDQIASRDYLVDVLTTYGFFAVILFILYVFIVSSIAGEDDLSLAPKYAALHRAGMSVSQMKRQKWLDALLRSLWQLLSAPLYALIHFAPVLLKLGESAERWQLTKGQYVLMLAKNLVTNPLTDPKAVFGVLLALMLMLVIVNRRLAYRE